MTKSKAPTYHRVVLTKDNTPTKTHPVSYRMLNDLLNLYLNVAAKGARDARTLNKESLEQGFSWLAPVTLQMKLQACEKTVRRATHQLVEWGYLEPEEQKHKYARYMRPHRAPVVVENGQNVPLKVDKMSSKSLEAPEGKNPTGSSQKITTPEKTLKVEVTISKESALVEPPLGLISTARNSSSYLQEPAATELVRSSTSSLYKACSSSVCDLPVYSKGFCCAHYHRQRKGRPTDTPVTKYVKDAPPICTHPTCDQPHFAHKLCRSHYIQTPHNKELAKKRRAKFNKTDHGRLKALHYREVRMARKAKATVDDSYKLFKFDDRCMYCWVEVDRKLPKEHPQRADMEHLIPLSKGGEHSIRNLGTACHLCNQRKFQKTSFEYYAQLAWEGLMDRWIAFNQEDK